jgi:hypothetical protein
MGHSGNRKRGIWPTFATPRTILIFEDFEVDIAAEMKLL